MRDFNELHSCWFCSQVAISVLGVTTGVQLYIFTLGIFVPWANADVRTSRIICSLIGVRARLVVTTFYPFGFLSSLVENSKSFVGQPYRIQIIQLTY